MTFFCISVKKLRNLLVLSISLCFFQFEFFSLISRKCSEIYLEASYSSVVLLFYESIIQVDISKILICLLINTDIKILIHFKRTCHLDPMEDLATEGVHLARTTP